METNFYNSNMQKILFVAKELHLRGYENIRVIPGVSPSGLSWRCDFFLQDDNTKNIPVSSWIYQQLKDFSSTEIQETIKDLTDKFERENFKFLDECKGKNPVYVKWYKETLKQLDADELPYAYSDYFTDYGNWKTTKEKLIKSLPDERNYF